VGHVPHTPRYEGLCPGREGCRGQVRRGKTVPLMLVRMSMMRASGACTARAAVTTDSEVDVGANCRAQERAPSIHVALWTSAFSLTGSRPGKRWFPGEHGCCGRGDAAEQLHERWTAPIVVSESSQPVGALRAPSTVCSPVEGQTATTGVGGHSHGLRWTPTFYVGSPSAMAPEWGQTGTRTVPCVWIELAGWPCEAPSLGFMWGHRCLCRARTTCVRSPCLVIDS